MVRRGITHRFMARGGGHHKIVDVLERAALSSQPSCECYSHSVQNDNGKFDTIAATGNNSGDDPLKLIIHDARYGWAANIWAPSRASIGGESGNKSTGVKDVTSIVHNDAERKSELSMRDELHLNPNRASQFFNLHFWPKPKPKSPGRCRVDWRMES